MSSNLLSTSTIFKVFIRSFSQTAVSSSSSSSSVSFIKPISGIASKTVNALSYTMSSSATPNSSTSGSSSIFSSGVTSTAAVSPSPSSSSSAVLHSPTSGVAHSDSASLSSTLSGPSSDSSSFWSDAYWKVRSWWIPSSHAKLEESEKAILSLVRKPFQQKIVDVGDGLFINTLHFQSPAASTTVSSSTTSNPSSAAVLLHGYAGGVGSWARNYDSLSALFPSLYSIDWLGTGRSSRPAWNAKGVEESEEFFVNSLENWRKANGISSLELIGHSMGGYLSCAYTLRYPQNVSRLILLSPVGMPRNDPAANDRFQHLSLGRRMLFGTIRWLFTSGITPNDMVKFLGPWGSRPVAGYFNNRFQFGERESKTNGEWRRASDGSLLHVPIYAKDIYANYHYHNLALEKSGDAVLSAVLGEFAFAHKPMIDRLPSVVIQHNIPTHFIYGSSDWMDVKCGKSMSQTIAEGQQKFVSNLPKAANGNAQQPSGTSFHIVEEAGHQLFIENPQGVYEAIKQITQIPAKKI